MQLEKITTCSSLTLGGGGDGAPCGETSAETGEWPQVGFGQIRKSKPPGVPVGRDTSASFTFKSFSQGLSEKSPPCASGRGREKEQV